MPMRIVVGGPRGCGKSTLVASMFSHLEATCANVGVHEIDVYSDTINCILGRKPWTERKKRVKAWFDPTIKRRIGEFVADQSRLVLGDLPGKITNPFLHKMVEPAHRAVIVAKDYEELEQWERFFSKQGIPVILRVMSCVHDRPSLPSGGYFLSCHKGRDMRAVVGCPLLQRMVYNRVILRAVGKASRRHVSAQEYPCTEHLCRPAASVRKWVYAAIKLPLKFRSHGHRIPFVQPPRHERAQCAIFGREVGRRHLLWKPLPRVPRPE